MSLLSTFINAQLIKAIEAEFLNNSEEIQSAIVSEVQAFVSEATAWLESKITTKPSTGA